MSDKSVPRENTVLDQTTTDATPPYNPAIAAAAQLIAVGERHGYYAVPPPDALASWLEENREQFVKDWQASQKKRRTPTRIRVQEDGSPRWLPSPGRRGNMPNRDSFVEIYRRIRRCRRKVCGVRKRISNLLTRVGAAVYPADEAETTQLRAFEQEIAKTPPPAQHPWGNDVRTPSPVPGNAEATEQSGASADDGNLEIQELRNPKPRSLHPWSRRLQEAEGDNFDEPHPGKDTVPPNGPALSPMPSPPEKPRRFHINQCAHLMPSYQAAQRAALAPKGQRPRWSTFGGQPFFYDNNNYNVSDSENNGNKQVGKYDLDGYRGTAPRGFRDIDRGARSGLNTGIVTRLRRGEHLAGELSIGGFGEDAKDRMNLMFVVKAPQDRVRLWGKGGTAGRISKVGKGRGKPFA
ncbi:hypothetical protein F5Y04DRAFT_151209 [Hypomontagnella monticulosa]|nr:hypothetical protein F5Y04DRAFT_151209 [Hypomontagnella monticulosa]